MLRNIINNGQKAVDATYTAHDNLKRGMGVVKSSNGVTAFLSSDGAKGIFIADKEPIDSGPESAYTIRSDYSDTYENIVKGEKLVLVPYVKGETFATDQVKGELAEGDSVTWGTDGLAKKSSGDTGYVCKGTVNDCDIKILYKIEVI